LDINMPEMNGYEVCERLKADERTRDIPVIFISALDETIDKVRAFGVGGVDYVTKPFQFDEVRARVETHLKISHLQKELQEKYEDLRRVEELKDNLTQMLVHDMRSPLQAVGGYVELLQMSDEGLGEEEQECLLMAHNGVKRLSQMVNDLLDVTRLEAGRMPLRKEEVDLRDVAREAVAALSGLTKDYSVVLDAPNAPVVAACDQRLLVRVVVNLLGNALRYSPTDGEIRISVLSKGAAARVEVHDQGPGVPEEHRAKIFEKFGQVEARQGKHKYSTGLGLTFCKLAMEAHDGTIGVFGGEEEGSTFWFELRRHDDETTKGMVERASEPAGRTPRVLVVDDEEDVCAFFKSTLEKHGYEIHTAPDGKVALEMVQTHPYDLVITDLVMPRKEGMELLMELRRAYAGMPVIVFTGVLDSGTDLLKTARLLGACETLEKPISPQLLTDAVSRALGQTDHPGAGIRRK